MGSACVLSGLAWMKRGPWKAEVLVLDCVRTNKRKRDMKRIILLLAVLGVFGCASLTDAPRNVVGFSTRDLEDARSRSVYQSYDCSLPDCFSAVLAVAAEKKYIVFSKDERRGLIVLMGVPGHVDTTEVAVFISYLEKGTGVRVELASRSSSARRVVAGTLFAELAKTFPYGK